MMAMTCPCGTVPVAPAEKIIEKFKEQKEDKEKAESNAAKTQALLDKKAKGYDVYMRKIGKTPGENKPKKQITKKKGGNK